MENSISIDLIEDEIVSIELCDVEDTIDITVADTHMFFANDIYTHNSGFDAELVEAHQSGGNIKRVQKAHFFMSVAKTPEQKEANLANFRIIKARFAQDGQTFKDAIYNNDTMEIRIEDSRYKNNQMYSEHRKYRDEDFDAFNEKANSLHVEVSNVEDAQVVEDNALLGDIVSKITKDKDIKKSIEENSLENPKVIDEAPNVENIDDGGLLEFDFDGDNEPKHITPDWIHLNEKELEEARKNLEKGDPTIEVKETGHVEHDMDAVNEMIIKKRKTKNE